MEDLKNVIDESGSAGGCGVDQYRRLAALLATTTNQWGVAPHLRKTRRRYDDMG